MSFSDVHGAKGRHFDRYLASFLQVEFVGGWSATELSPMHCQVRSGGLFGGLWRLLGVSLSGA